MEYIDQTLNLDKGYRTLAAAVITAAITDLSNKRERENAFRFLTSENARPIRTLWLSWIGYDDAAFQHLLRKKSHQGLENQIAEKLQAAITAAAQRAEKS